MSMRVNMTDEYIPCPNECENGMVEEMNCTVGSASLCCGGCYRKVTCETCEGSGEVVNENYDPEGFQAIQIHWLTAFRTERRLAFRISNIVRFKNERQMRRAELEIMAAFGLIKTEEDGN